MPTVATPLAVTLDDLPLVGRLRRGDSREAAARRIIAHLEGIPATGFFTCRNGPDREAAWRAWMDSPIGLANHTRSHRALDDLGLEAWREDVVACQRRLEESGRPVPFFRYPFLRTGADRALRDAGFQTLEELGLRRAPVTIDTSEWALVAAYARGDEGVAQEYVAHVRRAARRFRSIGASRGRVDVPQILLLHANALAADHLGTLLAGLREDGFRFVSLEEALADPLYAAPDEYVGPVGLSWFYRVEDAAEPDTRVEAWAWDAAQLHAMQVRFDGRRERAAFDLDRELSLRRIADRTWVVTHAEPWPANSLVAEMADGSLLFVDTPYTEEASRSLLDWTAARFGPRPMVVINTHFHPDALGGNAAFIDAGATVWASEHTARLARERQSSMRADLQRWLADRPEVAARFAEYAPRPPTRTFDPAEGLELDLDLGEPVRVSFPGAGHSPDNVVVHLEDRRVLFGGCLVVSHDRLGNMADADRAAWPAAIERLESLGARIIVPGHGERTEPELLAHTRRLLSE